jgi:hypothetical protein
MSADQESPTKGRVAAILAVVFTALSVASTTATAYVTGLWTGPAMMWAISMFVGGIVTTMLFIVAMIAAAFAIGEARTRAIGLALILLSVFGSRFW